MIEKRRKTFRLNSFVAKAAGISRRKADAGIFAGEVSVDGETTCDPSVVVGRDNVVRYRKQAIRLFDEHIWVLLNKPRGYITTKSDPHGRPTVMDLLPPEHKTLFPVGRLDSDTTGLLLLTNDGYLTQRLLHPKFRVPREYRVEISGRLSPDEVEIVRRGVILDGRRAVPSSLSIASTKKKSEIWRIELREGRYHEVKRLFSAVGHEVLALTRTSFAGIEIEKLPEGHWRLLRDNEIEVLNERLEKYAEG